MIVKMLRGEYIGTDEKLYGETADLVVKYDDQGNMFPILNAKFDNVQTGMAWGWHAFVSSQWELQSAKLI